MRRRTSAVLALVAFALIAFALMAISTSQGVAQSPSASMTNPRYESGGIAGEIRTPYSNSFNLACANILFWHEDQQESEASQKYVADSTSPAPLIGGSFHRELKYLIPNSALVGGKTYSLKAQVGDGPSGNACQNDHVIEPQTPTVSVPTITQPVTQQPQAAAAYYEIVLRGAVERTSNEAEPEPLTLYFPTRYLSDCEEWSRSPAQCGSLTFPDGVYEALDEAVSETVRENIWGSYVVTDEVGTALDWERRFRKWLDTKRLGFTHEERRYFALPGRAVFDLDLWIIYYMAERGMNSVRLAERPFDPPLTVCLPRPKQAPAGAMLAVWDKKEWAWQPLESLVSLDDSQLCALTPYVTVFSFVEAESVSELAQVP